MEKLCCRCKEFKSLTEFSRNSKSSDSKMSFCKDCDAKRQNYVRKVIPFIEFSHTQLAYLAGFIDGEGHIGLCKQRRNSGPFIGNNRFHVIFRIGITSTKIYDIQKEFGIGKLYVSKARKENHRDCIHWDIPSRQAKNLLPQLTPFLKIKKRQAELLYQYQNLPRTKNSDYQQKAIEIYDEIRKLNERGIKN